MIKIIKSERPVRPERRYRVPEVAKALGLSEGAVNGYFANRNISAKNGLTLEQIELVATSPKRGGIKWDEVVEIRTRLENERGITIIQEDDEF